MGRIKKITENELVGGTRSTDVYPVTSVKAVYDESNERLDNILGDLDNKIGALKPGIIYDVSAHNNGAVFESLSALLSSPDLNALIPTSVRHGGMSIRFIQGSEQSSDNKYVQYRLMLSTLTTAQFTNAANWQGVDDEPTARSNNLVKSGGVKGIGRYIRLVKNDVINGCYSANNGTSVDRDGISVVCPTFIHVTFNNILSFDNIENYKIAVYYYDANYNYIKVDWFAAITSKDIPSDAKYIRLGFRNSSSSSFNKDSFQLVIVNIGPFCDQATIRVNLAYSSTDSLPNFDTTNKKLVFSSNARVCYLGKEYSIGELPYEVSGETSFRLLVFNKKTKQLSFIGYDVFDPITHIIFGNLQYANSALNSIVMPFSYTINGINDASKILSLENKCFKQSILKYGNNTDALPNFNLTESKLEFPATALVQYGKTVYTLGENYSASSFDIPTSGSILKFIVFDINSHLLSVIASNLLDVNSQVVLGWFVLDRYELGSYDLPFPSFTVNGKRINDVSDKIEDNSWLLFKDVIALQGHFFMEHIYMDSNVIYPSQTIADIHFCSRIGVKSIEANCLKTATPGKYIVMHGEKGCVGYQMMLKKEAYEANPSAYPYAKYDQQYDAYYNFDPNEPKDILNGYIPLTPYDDLRNNYFNRSLYPKYRTPITDMEEFLEECKTLDIFPIITYCDDAQIPIIEAIVGKKYALRANWRHGNVLHILWVDDKKTKEEALAICNRYGRPFMYGMDVAVAAQYTDSELQELVDYLHSYGYFIVFDGNYYDEEKNQRLKQMNFDGQTTNWDIPKFENGNVCNLSADIDYSDFTHNGTVADNELILAVGNAIEPDFNFENMFISKAYLEIRFAGTITISMGKVTGTFVSDGSKTTVFSNVFLNSQTPPKFVITAVSETKVIDIVYRVSKC